MEIPFDGRQAFGAFSTALRHRPKAHLDCGLQDCGDEKLTEKDHILSSDLPNEVGDNDLGVQHTIVCISLSQPWYQMPQTDTEVNLSVSGRELLWLRRAARSLLGNAISPSLLK